MHILQITASLLLIFPFMTDIPKLSTHHLSAGVNSMARLVVLSAIVAIFSFESFLAHYIANIHIHLILLVRAKFLTSLQFCLSVRMTRDTLEEFE